MSSIGYVRERVDEALSRMGTVDDVEVISGFPVRTGKKENPFVRGFQDSRIQLEARLRAKGVEPMAVVPLSWWDEIVSRSGLVDVDTTARYEFRIDLDLIGRIVSLRNALAGAIGVGTGLATIGAAYTIGGMPALTVAAGLSILPGAGATWAAVRYLLRAETMVRAFDMRGGLLPRVLFRSEKKWPEGEPVEITFPPPPADVVEVLRKTAETGFDVRVAAERSAVAFSIDPVLYVADQITRREIILRERRARVAADPIVYVRLGEAVAILAQFGDFPIEKRVIDSVVGKASREG